MTSFLRLLWAAFALAFLVTPSHAQYGGPLPFFHSGSVPPSLDGTDSGGATTGTNATTAGLTTSFANDIIVVTAYEFNGTTTVSTVAGQGGCSGLSFAKRSAEASGANDLEVWWALSSGTLSACQIKVTFGASTSGISIVAFGVSGANTSSPWDANVSLPVKATAASGIPTTTGISTTSANDLLLGFEGNNVSTTQTAGSGYNLILSINSGSNANAAAEYQKVTLPQSSVSATFGTSVGNQWLMISDAIKCSSC